MGFEPALLLKHNKKQESSLFRPIAEEMGVQPALLLKHNKKQESSLFRPIAEEMGFEPMVELPPRQFSKLVPSAARSPLHEVFTRT